MADYWFILSWMLTVCASVEGGKVNVAVDKPASSSSGYYGSWLPSKAVDGDINIEGEATTCFHALYAPSDWTVDLKEPYQLYDIMVYLRKGYNYRTANSSIYLDNNSSRVCFTFPSTITDNPTNVTCNGTARYVTIRNPGRGPGHQDVLNVCEVEIYVCIKETYGTECNKDCHCPKCDRLTGVCSGNCNAGWQGDRCDESCNSTNYGINCHEKCSKRKCASYSSCDRETGKCDTGCLSGWKKDVCTKECDHDHYGLQCQRRCINRQCFGNSSCNHVTGSCDHGCKAGWKSQDCRKECDDKEHYGRNCNQTCDTRNCLGTSTCRRDTGACNSGCNARWKGIDCKDCDGEHYGPDCNRRCAARHCIKNSSCNPTAGLCDGGCQTGWAGTDCLETVSALQFANMVVIAGVTIGVVLLLMMVIILTFLLVRRRNRNHKRSSTSKQHSHEGDVYMNIEERQQNHESPMKSGLAVQLAQLNSDGGEACEANQEEEEDEEGPELPERNYYNLDDVRVDHAIPVSGLETRVREMEQKPETTVEEFKDLPEGFFHPYDESQKSGNKEMNRFKGYYPYNYNRVVLQDEQSDIRGDYINASYMDGYKSEKKYIAAQGPYKEAIIEDFWRMVWQEGCEAVVMVTDIVEGGKMKCLRYWPEEGTSTYGEITVTMETEMRLAGYTIRKLRIQHSKDSRKWLVFHFHFTSWPDHGVPDTTDLLTFMKKVNDTAREQTHPTVVHCSAGIGRTGTYIAVESLVSQTREEGTVNVVRFVSDMRNQRKNMIQTKEQYLFIYQAVTLAVVEGDTSLDADVIRQINLDHVGDVTMGNRTVSEHLQYLRTHAEGNKSRNDIIGIPSHRFLSGFLVMTSLPDKDMVWNKIHNSTSRSLITWSSDDQSFLPSAKRPVSTSRLRVSLIKSAVLSDHAALNIIEIKCKGDTNSTVIQHYHVTGSVRHLGISGMIDSLLQWTSQPECETTTVMSNSASESRLLVLLANITSRLQEDGKVDIICNIRRLQSLLGGPSFTQEDVKFCLSYAQHRQESLEMYANL